MNKFQETTSAQTFWKGWIKFFNYNSGRNDPDKPTSFFVNNDYFKQVVTNSDRIIKDNIGWKYIPTKFHFFALLMNNNFNILTSRQDDTVKTVDSLNLDLIIPVNTKGRAKASMLDLGNFAEGSCFSVDSMKPIIPDLTFDANLNSPNSVKQKWIICLDKNDDKKKLFNLMTSLRVGKQKKDAERKDKLESDVKNVKTLGAALGKSPTKSIIRGSNPNDGYLILLQDWSQCTLKCGGGVEVQQWMCVPPREGGKPCKGELIRKRPCHTQPCPGTTFTSGEAVVNNKSPLDKVLKPVIKSLPISNRPQNYLPCQINDANVLMEQKLNGLQKPVRVPGRLVMNLRTISLFSDDTYSNAIFSFNLRSTVLSSDNKDHCCFLLDAENKSYRICAFGDCGTKEDPDFLRFWQHTYSEFKEKCYENLSHEDSSKSLSLPDVKNDGSGSSGDNILGSMNMSVEEANTKSNMITQKFNQRQESQIVNQIKKTENVALNAIKKEINIEELIKREMIVKSKQEADELVAIMRHEKRKKDQLEKIFKARESEDVIKREARAAVMQVKAIQNEAKKEVEKKREALRLKIQEIKQKSLRRKKIIEQQISMIRAQMANSLIAANKEGDSTVCKEGIGNRQKIDYYCNKRIVDDINKNIECKSFDSFCYVCCENEFGNMYMEKRDQCYDLCDKKYSKELEAGGDFIWKK